MGFIYFDFDGTIADSFALGIEITDELAEKYNFKKVDKSKIEYYRNMSSQELLKEFNIPYYKIPILAPLFKLEFTKHLDKLQPVENIASVLQTLSQEHFLGILTSNSEDNVRKFLQKHNLLRYVKDIRSEFQIFGKHKSLKKIINSHSQTKENFIYVGDETRDIEAANKVGIRSIAVLWGFNSEKALLKHNPSFLAKNAGDILDFVKESFR